MFAWVGLMYIFKLPPVWFLFSTSAICPALKVGMLTHGLRGFAKPPGRELIVA